MFRSTSWDSYVHRLRKPIVPYCSEDLQDTFSQEATPAISGNSKRLSYELFKIQAKESLAGISASAGKLFVVSCVEKPNALCSLPAQPLINVGEGSKRKKKCDLLSNEETNFSAEQGESLKMKKRMEPTTPLKPK